MVLGGDDVIHGTVHGHQPPEPKNNTHTHKQIYYPKHYNNTHDYVVVSRAECDGVAVSSNLRSSQIPPGELVPPHGIYL